MNKVLEHYEPHFYLETIHLEPSCNKFKLGGNVKYLIINVKLLANREVI
jgi:hypothetical protein